MQLESSHNSTNVFDAPTSYFSLISSQGTKASKGISMDMLDQVVKDIKTKVQPYNLSQYVKAFMSRTDFINEIHDQLKCHVLIITSNHSPYKEEAYTMLSK